MRNNPALVHAHRGLARSPIARVSQTVPTPAHHDTPVNPNRPNYRASPGSLHIEPCFGAFVLCASRWGKTSFDDPQIVALYRALDTAFDLEPGDPRLDELAGLFERMITYADANEDGGGDEPIDDDVAALLDVEAIGRSPGWRHLGKLLEQRGWSGWTNVEPQRADG
jgi:hypothetical protein